MGLLATARRQHAGLVMWLLILFIWTFAALLVGCVVGLAIANAEKPLPELDAPEPDDIDWQHWDVTA